MITNDMITVTLKVTGVCLSAKTEKGNYGQFYNMVNSTRPSFVPDVQTARQRFMKFYNQYE